MFDFIFSLLTIYLVVGAAVAVYAKITAKINFAGALVVTLFWPLFIFTGFKMGLLSGGSDKKYLK